MRDKAHVGLVDTHPECDRCDDHDAVLVDEAILVSGAQAGVEAGMIGQRRNAGLAQRGCGVLDPGPRQAIDDAGVAGMTFGDEGLELRLRVLLVDDLIADIRAVEARDKARRAGESEAIDDLAAGQFVGGGGQRDARYPGKSFGDGRQADIFRAKVVSPLRHAMRLVDRKQGDRRTVEQVKAAWRQEPLRGDIEQVEITGEQALLDRGGFVPRQGGIQHRGLDPGLDQPGDLVAHQCDQRRDHDAAAPAQQRRQLIAQRLAAARGHQHEAIAAVHDMADDGFLRPAKGGQAEHGIQHGKRVGSKAGHPHRSIPDSGGRAYSLSDGFRAKAGLAHQGSRVPAAAPRLPAER